MLAGLEYAFTRSGIFIGNQSSNPVASGSQDWKLTVTAHDCLADDVIGVAALYINSANDRADITALEPIDVTACAVDPTSGLRLPLRFRGADAVTLPPDSWALTDIAPVRADAGDRVLVGTLVENTGGIWPHIATELDGAKSEGSSGGTGAASLSPREGGGSFPVNGGSPSAQAGFAPAALVAYRRGARLPQVLILGDSLFQGLAEGGTQPLCGFIARALIAAEIPFLSVARGGEAGYQFLSLADRPVRSALMAHPWTDVVGGYAANDLRDLGAGGGAPANLAALQAQDQAFLALAAELGARAHLFTILPYAVTSTDGFATVENQTQSNTARDDVRLAWSDWRLSLHDPDAGIVVHDVAAAVTAGAGRRFWVPGSLTDPTGIHYNPTGAGLMVPEVDTAAFG